MSTASTDPRDIEAELERDRAQLASTLDELSDRVSVDSLARDALDSVKSYAGSYTATLDGAVRTNPVAVALVGVGLAWLAFSGHRRSTSEDEGSGYVGYAGGPEHDDGGQGYSASTGGAYAGSSYAGSSYAGGSDAEDDNSWWSSVGDLRAKAMQALQRIERDARSAASRVGSSLSGGAGSARDFAAERATVVSSFAGDLRSRLSHGLDALPESARQRVIAARERAYAASLRAERVGRQAITDPARAMEEHPLAAGAVAFALGAAVAAMLPRTDMEDRAFGADRDRLMDEAARLLRSERARALEIASSLTDEVKAAATEAVDEVRAVASEAVGDVVDSAKARASEAASRVGGVAADEADRLADAVTSRSQSQGSDPALG